jgi:hypothetical protein
MGKEYLVKSSFGGSYYGTGFVSVEIINEDKLKLLQSLVEKRFSFHVYNWEGKHSELIVRLDHNDFVVLSDKPEDIEAFRRIFLSDEVGNITYSEFVLDKYYDSEEYEEEEEDDE